jgi:hypothetical protein
MAGYAFETPEFGLNEAGLHRLRSRFVFETIPYAAMHQVKVTRGLSVQNWWLLLAFGLGCLGFAALSLLSIWQFLVHARTGQVNRLNIRAIAVPIIPAVVGALAIWQSLQVEDILVVRYGKRRLVLPLSKLKTGHVAGLPAYLARRTAATA